jgi:nitroreductase/Pyruvate/2-oxoacid:ferredoxin oxidoreductase delta subunit
MLTNMKNEHNVSIDSALCTKCGLCKKVCMVNRIAMTDNGAHMNHEFCTKCAQCVAVCPQNAISISGFEDAPETITADMKLDAKTLIGQLKARRSMRNFTKQDVPDEIIEQIIQAGQYTPSAGNLQPVSYVVLRENIVEAERIARMIYRKIERVGRIFSKRFRMLDMPDDFLFRGAPVVILIKSKNIIDGALAASNMELMAQALGVGAMHNAAFTWAIRMSRKLKTMLHLRNGEKAVLALVLGYPAVKYQRTAPREKPTIIYK